MLIPSHSNPQERQSFIEGLRTCMPTLPGIAAWGLVVGVAMVKSGLSVPWALLMTFSVFAGTAQLASLPLIAINAPVWIIVLTSFLINLRFVIFSALLAPHFAGVAARKKWLYGYFTGDVPLALFIQRYPTISDEPGRLSFLLGLISSNWIIWQVGSVTGILLGSQIPLSWEPAFAGTLAMMCVVLPFAKQYSGACAAIVGGVVGVLTYHLPYKLGLVIAVICGMLAALICEEIKNRKQLS